MKLIPSLRQKKRYMVFAIISSTTFSAAEVKEEVRRALQQFLGEWGVAQAGPLFLGEKFNAQSQKFLLKVNHNYIDELKAALTLCTKIKNSPVIIKSVTTSGTLKKASLFLKE